MNHTPARAGHPTVPQETLWLHWGYAALFARDAGHTGAAGLHFLEQAILRAGGRRLVRDDVACLSCLPDAAARKEAARRLVTQRPQTVTDLDVLVQHVALQGWVRLQLHGSNPCIHPSNGVSPVAGPMGGKGERWALVAVNFA